MAAGPLSFARRRDGRVLAGVAGGFADRHGVDPTLVRAALVLLSFAGGVGVVLYAIGALVADPAPAPGDPVPAAAPVDPLRNLSVVAVTAGVALVVRSTGLWLGDAVMLPVGAVIAGVVVAGVLQPWRSRDTTAWWSGRFGPARLVVGAILIAAGLAVVGAGRGLSGGLRVGVWATAVTVFGVALLMGPWMARMAREAADERRERIRSEEREAMAAHLHDSVLQTLALIQRTADDPRRTVALARRQEAELREWLFGAGSTAPGSLAAAVRAAVQDVELGYAVAFDTVVVGDAELDDRLAAFVAAVREACVNAAKHAGVTTVSVFVEVGGGRIEAFVRDRGVGFDPSAVAPDRRGIAESIVARLRRAGGDAEVESAPGEGTEVRLILQHADAGAGSA